MDSAKLPHCHPPCHSAKNQAAANEEQRVAEEMPREAIGRLLENRRWQRLFAYGENMRANLASPKANISRLIAESRRERAQSTSVSVRGIGKERAKSFIGNLC